MMEPDKTPDTPPENDKTDMDEGLSLGHSSGTHSTPKVRKLFVVLGILGIILLGLLAGLVYYFAQPVKTNHSDTKVTNSSKDTSASNDKSLTAAQLVQQLKTAMANGQDVADGGAPSARPDGYDFYVNIYKEKVSYSVKANGTDAQMVANREAARTVFKKNGLTETVYQESNGDAIFEAGYLSKGIACGANEFKPYQPTAADMNTYAVQISCADMSSYQQVAKAVKPFVVVYAAEAKQDKDTTKLAFSSPTITKSSVAGYQRAEVSISGAQYGAVGGFAGLFYQTPDKLWHYFTGSQSLLSCDMYNTTDLKNAYAGEKCYDANNNEIQVSQ